MYSLLSKNSLLGLSCFKSQIQLSHRYIILFNWNTQTWNDSANYLETAHTMIIVFFFQMPATKIEFYVGDVPSGMHPNLQNARYTRLG